MHVVVRFDAALGYGGGDRAVQSTGQIALVLRTGHLRPYVRPRYQQGRTLPAAPSGIYFACAPQQRIRL